MNSIKLQPIITSLNIDYQRGQSLILEVNAAIKQKQSQFLIWSIVLIIGLIGLALAFQFTTLLDFDTKGILWLVGFVLLLSFSIFQIVRNYSKTPYSFQKIAFLPDKIEVQNKGTRTVPIPSNEYALRLNQAGERPQITILFDNKSVHFQLDSMQDFPIVTDAIADVLKFEFKEHQIINDEVEELTFKKSKT